MMGGGNGQLSIPHGVTPALATIAPDTPIQGLYLNLTRTAEPQVWRQGTLVRVNHRPFECNSLCFSELWNLSSVGSTREPGPVIRKPPGIPGAVP